VNFLFSCLGVREQKKVGNHLFKASRGRILSQASCKLITNVTYNTTSVKPSRTPTIPKSATLSSKVVKNDSKIVVSLYQTKSEYTLYDVYLFKKMFFLLVWFCFPHEVINWAYFLYTYRITFYAFLNNFILFHSWKVCWCLLSLFHNCFCTQKERNTKISNLEQGKINVHYISEENSH